METEVAKSFHQREVEVLMWASRGLSTAETGEQMGLSFETVKIYRSRAIRSLNANNMTHAVVKALRRGIIFFESHDAGSNNDGAAASLGDLDEARG